MKHFLVLLLLFAVLTTSNPGRPTQEPGSDPATTDPASVDPEFPPTMLEVAFESGGARLNGLVYVADGPGPHPTTLLLHGYPGNERNLDLAQALRRAGTNVVYFDYRGTWGSGGDFSFAHALEDVARVVETVRDRAATYRADPDRIAIVGHSFGGFLGAMTTAGDVTIDCYAHLAGANLGAIGLLAREDEEIRESVRSSLAASMDPRGGPVDGAIGSIVDDLVDRAETYLLPARASDLASRPLLVVAGTRDELTPKAEHHDPLVAALEEVGAERLTEVVYEDDHYFSAHRVDLARRLVDWQRAECWH